MTMLSSTVDFKDNHKVVNIHPKTYAKPVYTNEGSYLPCLIINRQMVEIFGTFTPIKYCPFLLIITLLALY